VRSILVKENKELYCYQGGDCIGDLSIALDLTQLASIQAVTETSVFVVHKQNLGALLRKFPNFAEYITVSRASKEKIFAEYIDISSNSTPSSLLDWVRNKINVFIQKG